ncbi:MAG: restriction endonuclease subunit S, partial [Actinobacteria bacterium]|nr:restriction endonuclease subunit S [Actinomycetota bacterium]
SGRIESSMNTAGLTCFRKRDVLIAKITPCFENGKGACLEDMPTNIGFGSTEFHVLRAGKEVAPKFLEAVTRTRRFRQLGADAMTGSAGQQRVPTEFVGCYVVALPPPTEQDLIVRFLAHANARIDRAIAAKRKMIGLLEEQKQVEIGRLVCGELDGKSPMKESGFTWLGSIPANWEVVRAKNLFREVDERSSTGVEEQLSISHLTGVSPRRFKSVTMFHASSYVGHKRCRPGDLVVNTMWAWMGALGVTSIEGIVSPAYAVYRPISRERLLPSYANLLLRTPRYTANFRARSTGIRPSRFRLYPDQFLVTQVLLPPIGANSLLL